jgi:hypothetical protein
MKAIPEGLIRARAHEIWEQNGRPSGLEKQHWEQAEREFLDAAALLAGAEGVGSQVGERRDGLESTRDQMSKSDSGPRARKP